MRCGRLCQCVFFGSGMTPCRLQVQGYEGEFDLRDPGNYSLQVRSVFVIGCLCDCFRHRRIDRVSPFHVRCRYSLEVFTGMWSQGVVNSLRQMWEHIILERASSTLHFLGRWSAARRCQWYWKKILTLLHRNNPVDLVPQSV